jgi:predicted NBD/HSP70 family sugar kinase
LTGLDAKTITNLSNELLRQNLIAPLDTVTSGRGRPPTNLTLNAHAAYALGVDIGSQQCSVVTIDFQGHPLRQSRHDFGDAVAMPKLLEQACRFLNEHLDALTPPQKTKISGVGMTFPGLLDRRAGSIISCVNIPESQNIPIVAQMQKDFPFPFFLEEASRSMARAELWYDPLHHPQDFIVVDIGYGIGLGIVIDGEIFRGTNEKCGEIGHVTVASPGEPCRCGNVGCLETIAGGRALARQAQQLCTDQPDHAVPSASDIFRLARQGHVPARHLLQQMAESLGLAIAHVINLFDPGCVILNGQLILADDYLLPAIIAGVHKHALKSTASKTVIRKTNLERFSGAMGAAMLPLLHYFQMDHIRFQ